MRPYVMRYALLLTACGAETADAPDVAASVRTCVADVADDEPTREVLTLRGDDLSIGLVRSVDPDALSGADTKAWVLERVAYARGDVAECVAERARLEYLVSHHNFDDELTAALASGIVRVHAELSGFAGPVRWRAELPSGSATPDVVPLSLASCRVAATDDDCRSRYE